MKFCSSLLLSAALLTSSASLLPARDSTAVTSGDLVAEALQKNPEVRFYEAEIAAARGGRQSAGQLANPELSTEMGGMSLAAQKDGLVWRAQILQTFDFPGRMSLRKAIADRDITLAELGLFQFKSQLSNEVRARAGDVLLLKRKEDAARSVRERLEALIDVLVQRDTGSVSALLERRILEATLLTSDTLNLAKYQNGPAADRLLASAKLVRTWADCYGYLLVATGQADVMLDPIMNPWDIAALVPIIRPPTFVAKLPPVPRRCIGKTLGRYSPK